MTLLVFACIAPADAVRAPAVAVPVILMAAKVGELDVPILCGKLSVTAPVGDEAITWLAVPVIDDTSLAPIAAAKLA